MAQTFNIKNIVSGDTVNLLSFTCLRNGAAVDFAGASAYFQIRDSSDNLMLSVTSSDGLSFSSNVITTDFECDIVAGSYLYDIRTVESDGTITTWFRGKFDVIDNITELP